jgi:hypothetical protein
MKNIIYPAIFHVAEEGGYWIEFPDLPGCFSSWKEPSKISDIKVEGNDFVTLIKAEPYESEDAVKFRAARAVEEGLAKRNLNKSQASQILGVDRSYFTYIINGKKTPSPEMAKRIGLLLNFDWTLFYADKAN